MIWCHIFADRRICHYRPGGSAFRAADHIYRKAIVVKILHHLNHGQVEAVNIPHIVEALSFFLSEFHRIIIKFLYRHPRISFCKISCQLLACGIARLNLGSCRLQIIRYSLRVIHQAIIYEHHSVIVSIISLAGKCTVHIEYGYTVLCRDIVFRIFFIRNL